MLTLWLTIVAGSTGVVTAAGCLLNVMELRAIDEALRRYPTFSNSPAAKLDKSRTEKRIALCFWASLLCWAWVVAYAVSL